MVTYNDRQEILCQKCTDIALNETDEERSPLQQRVSMGNSRSMDREVGRRIGRGRGRVEMLILSPILLWESGGHRGVEGRNHFIDVASPSSDHCDP